MPIRTETISESGAPFRLGDWLVEPSLNRVSRGATTVQLERKAMDVLVFLAERAGEVVSRIELQDAVWQTEFVADNTLVKRIAQIREALGDDPRQPRFVETIPKRGYRLIAEVGSAGELDETVAPFPERGPAEVGRGPYPGLRPFTEADAADFFGRGAEIVELWRKITSRRLLAVVGPSGAGKSSLLRAGVIARAPSGWRAVTCHPGKAPFVELARALAPDFAGDSDDVQELLRFQDPDVALAMVSRWRGRWEQALVVVDQFEELFTLHPPAVQEEFVGLLRRLVDAAGIHVVLVLRDDFLYECHRFPVLEPILRDLTLVGPPLGPALRRALTEPAKRRLHRFESELLVDEMVAEVERERGALPLLAFAASRLWELRDREQRLLTREAYERIDGVGGALAQHAEATLEAIGTGRLPVVRELFCNLVTAQGTRAVRDGAELLSVFPAHQRPEAEAVLAALIEARLLTSFSDQPAEGEPDSRRHLVEIVHESLLGAWPRLQRWHAQDAEGALLRDQLRQSAQLWAARGRPEDLLWTEASYREYGVWRERYPGGLSAVEEEFAGAMTALAGRLRRRRRLLAASLFAALAAVAVTVTGLWRRAEHEARRVEARRMFEIGRRTIDASPPEALAWAVASLELEDDPSTRRLALQALWRSPMSRVPTIAGRESHATHCAFSPDGRWLETGMWDGRVNLWSASGGEPVSWKAHTFPVGGRFAPDSRVLFTFGLGSSEAGIWAVPDGRRLAVARVPDEWAAPDMDPGDAMTLSRMDWIVADPNAPGGWTMDLEPSRLRRRLQRGHPPRAALGPDGRRLLFAIGPELYLADVSRPDAAARAIGRCAGEVSQIAFARGGDLVATVDAVGVTTVWSLKDGRLGLLRRWQGFSHQHCNDLVFDPSGRFAAACFDGGYASIHGLDDPAGAEPLRLQPAGDRMLSLGFHPSGRWLACAGLTRASVFPFERARHPYVLRGHAGAVERIAFAPSGSELVSCGVDGTVRLWPLSGSPPGEPRTLFDWGHPVERVVASLDISADGRVVVATGGEGRVRVIPLDGRPQRDLVFGAQRVVRAAVSGDGRLVAAAAPSAGHAVLRIWNLETDEVTAVDLPDSGESVEIIVPLRFTRGGRLLAGIGGRLLQWDPTTREVDEVLKGPHEFGLDEEGRAVIGREAADGQSGVVSIGSLDDGSLRALASHGSDVVSVALDPSGEIAVTGSRDGSVRVGAATGQPPHTLVIDDAGVLAVAVSPDGRWIASGHVDGTIRLWAMPELDRPPILELRHRELLALLRSQTNLRAVPDPEDPGNYVVQATEPFPGWEAAPSW